MNELRCTCCGMPADSVLETPASGVSFLCFECGELLFSAYISQGGSDEACRMVA